MRERRAVVVLAAPDGDVGLPTIADPIFLINGAFCHDGGYQKVARANREVVIRQANFCSHGYQDGSLDLCCCSSKRDGALVILADIKTSFGSQIFGDGISGF